MVTQVDDLAAGIDSFAGHLDDFQGIHDFLAIGLIPFAGFLFHDFSQWG
jgi:hypothetical protein